MENELKHYGVLGMKWGVHKANKNGTEYHYKSMTTKGHESAMNNALARGNTKRYNQHKEKSKYSNELDKKYQDYSLSQSPGKIATKILLGGTFMTKTYDLSRAAGLTRLQAGLVSAGSMYIGGPVGNMAANEIIRNNYVHERIQESRAKKSKGL